MTATSTKDATNDAAALVPKGCTNQQVRQLMRRLSQFYDFEVGKSGLRGTQYSLLANIAKLGPMRPGDLAKSMKIDPSTLSRNLRPLIASGWVTLQDGDDARSRSITVTEAGSAKRVEAQRRWKVAQEGINRTLGIPRVLALHALIQESLELLETTGTAHD